jgi:hypothetical protein
MSTITLIPSGTSTTTAIGLLDGRWYADGTDNPVGSYAYLRPAVAAPDLTWQMANTTAGQWLVTSQTLTAADWDASPIPVDVDGFKRIPLRVINPTWPTPSSGDAIDFQTQAASGWEIRTGTVTSGRYELVIVPEPVGLAVVAALAFIVLGRLLRQAY